MNHDYRMYLAAVYRGPRLLGRFIAATGCCPPLVGWGRMAEIQVRIRARSKGGRYLLRRAKNT